MINSISFFSYAKLHNSDNKRNQEDKKQKVLEKVSFLY